MDDAHRQSGVRHVDDAAPPPTGGPKASPDGEPYEDGSAEGKSEEPFEETVVEEVSALIEDGRTYAEAELAFQKSRARFAGKLAGVSIGLVLVALVLFHIALLALAVGLVIALAPFVTIWGAILIVVGGLLLMVGILGWMAKTRASKLGNLFSSSGEGEKT